MNRNDMRPGPLKVSMRELLSVKMHRTLAQATLDSERDRTVTSNAHGWTGRAVRERFGK